MPNPDPVSEVNRQMLMDVLENVQTLAADTTIKSLSVEAVNRYGNNTDDLEASVELGVDEWVEETSDVAVVGKDTYLQEYLVFVSIQTPTNAAPTPTPDFDQRANHIAADVRKTVMAAFDAGSFPLMKWIKPRGMAGETRGLRYFTNDAGQTAGIVIPFTSLSTTALNDPYAPILLLTATDPADGGVLITFTTYVDPTTLTLADFTWNGSPATSYTPTDNPKAIELGGAGWSNPTAGGAVAWTSNFAPRVPAGNSTVQ